VDGIHLAQDSDQWRTPVNKVIKLCSIKDGVYLHNLNDYQLLTKDYVPKSYLDLYRTCAQSCSC
jgi:hypothetical protein